MKKLLLSLFAVLLTITATAQTTVTFDVATDKSANATGTKNDAIKKDGITITVSEGVLGNGNYYQCYKVQTMTVTSEIGNIASIEVTCTAEGASKYGPGCFTTEAGTYTYEKAIGTWTGDAASVALTAKANQVRMTKIVVTTAAAAGTVAKPTVKPASGTYYGAQTVTMTAAEGCTIKYKMNDGEEQTYAEAFQLTEPGTYTIVSYAVDADNKKSEEVTNTIEIKGVANYTTIAALREACTATAKADAPTVSYTFENLLVTGVSGSNIFVSDGTNGYILYGSNTKELKKGDKISGSVTGLLYQYNSLGELAVSDEYANVKVASSNNEVAAAAIAIDDAISKYSTYEASFVKFAGVKFLAEAIGTVYGEKNYRTVAIEDEAGDNLNIYDTGNILKTTTFDTGKTYDVYCYVVKYNETVQVYVLDVADIQLITDLKTPTSHWIAGEVAIFLGSDVINKFTTDSDGVQTYSSSDPTVATIDATTGEVTVVGPGTCTITAETAETATYLASSASYKLTVREHIGGLEAFTNGGFEEWLSDSQPTGWKSTTTASLATLEKSTEAHGGEYSVCIKNTTKNQRLASKEFRLDAGWYTIQFYAKSVSGAENLAEARPGYAPYDEENKKLGSYVYGDYTSPLSSTEWTLVKFTFKLEESTQLNLVVMNPKSSDKATYGDLLVDDFEFRAATEDEIAALGISNVKIDAANGALYNAAGQKVNADYRGIVINNGKKYMNK